MEYVMLIFFWGIYFLLHSLLAAENIKKYFLEQLGISLQNQRIIYTVISSVGLLVLLLYNGMIDGKNLLPDTQGMKVLSLFIATGGILVGKATFRSYDLRSFLGFGKEENGKLHVSGIFAYVRHPLYTATILMVIGFLIYDPRLSTLVSAGCIMAYIPIGIYLEEKKLLREFGEAYKRYKKNVPMLIPHLGFS